LRLLIVAPFERGREHGGSQRATTIAERLEERGARVDWHRVQARATPAWSKARAALALQPALADLYAGAAPPPRGDWDVALAAHSFVAPQLDRVGGARSRVVDFHNLEWRHLADAAALEAPRPGRRAYLAGQVALLRRFERRVVARHPLSLFTSAAERDWASAVRGHGRLAVVPNLLPRASRDAAAAVAARRDGGGANADPSAFAYVGTLRFPPNLMSLLRFLRDSWPAVRDAVPGARLTVAGDCSDDGRRAIDAFDGVESAGFVDDLGGLLASCRAVLLPFDSAAGTSLRALYYALAGVPVIGSPSAFRGVPFALGASAATPDEWAAAAAAARTEPGARESARLLHDDPAPWDHLHEALAGTIGGAPAGT
jgi:hypothetical protein